MSRRRPASNPTQASLALADAVSALEAAGVTPWLTDGTLLGAIRERAFIPHDQDMDLGAMITEYTPAALRELDAAGFTIRKTLGTKSKGLQTKLERDGFRIDIFWHYDTRAGGVWHAAWAKGQMLRFDYSQLVLERLSFLGREYWAPSPPRLHLVAKYGPDWRTPDPTWDWARDPKNRRK